MEVSTGSVTALIGAPLLLWLLPRLKSMSAPDMNASDRVAAERRHVLALPLPVARSCCWQHGSRSLLGRDAHGWDVGRAERCLKN
ncbi:iron-hydroxamate transporter permease subunit [Salmonella enterica subsp. enterica]|uniref:Iron-hydroxamate transporter permease subunit n=1 Tax=Salmonella enterica I TaxID=59201 RepID=A0A379X1Q1_SALET|nr:iron-hydroxamate transporter permease subunit [Salmonella enterica subsp. enterica]